MAKKLKSKITFKPKQSTKKLLKELKDRARYVVSKRFGLDDGVRYTLESIGAEYGITRERVRQIENFALNNLRRSQSYKEIGEIFDELKEVVHELGGIVSEKTLLEHLSNDPVHQNHVRLYLVLGDSFTRHKENPHFQARWSVNRDHAEKVEQMLRDIHSNLSKDDLLTEQEIVSRILAHDYMNEISENHQDEEVVRRWLDLSKKIGNNPLNDWGLVSSPNIKIRGVRDYAYLVMRRHGSPLHFREVADAIEKTFGKKTHVATTHNELIKDKRFVLVGRGLYSLRSWGYREGVVREVIKEILKEEGPLSRDEVIDRVLKERYLKRNTILVNLQNPKYFIKDDNGLYSIA